MTEQATLFTPPPATPPRRERKRLRGVAPPIYLGLGRYRGTVWHPVKDLYL